MVEQINERNELLFQLKKSEKELDYFSLFFDDKIITEIVNNSKKYFLDKFPQPLVITKNSYWDLYKKYNFNKNHFKAYLAAIIYMGIEPKKRIEDYWSCDPMFLNSFLPKYFSRNFFFYISAIVHMEIPNKNSQNDPREKINTLIQELVRRFQEYYSLGEHITIDESLVFSKARQKMKFYLPAKPHKWGFKLHLLCDSISDYVYNILFDPGKSYKSLIKSGNNNLTQSIVLYLVQGLENKNHILYMDSWYTSIELAKKLKEKGIDFTGILKNNALGLPKEEYSKYDIDSTIKLFFIEDRKTLNFISSIHDDKIEDNDNKPNIQKMYNKNVRSIDYVNQISSIYSLDNKTYKWWKKILFFMIDIVISNSVILMELKNSVKIDNLNFRKKLIIQLLEEFSLEEELQFEINKAKPCFIPYIYRIKLHSIEHTPNKRKRCRECQEKCVYICKECSIYLHPQCFLKYHNRNVYTN